MMTSLPPSAARAPSSTTSGCGWRRGGGSPTSVVACGLPHHGRGDLALAAKEIAAVQGKVAGLRRFGAAALDLAWVAAGRFDAFWERDLAPWDIAAGIILVREAGGYATDLDGGESPHPNRRGDRRQRDVHRELLRLLKTPVNKLTAETDRQLIACRALLVQPLYSHYACTERVRRGEPEQMETSA